MRILQSGLIMNVLALKREIPNPTMAQIKEYLSVIYADAQDIRDSTAPLQNILEWRSSAKDGKYQICK